MAYPNTFQLKITQDFSKEINPLPIYVYHDFSTGLTRFYNPDIKSWVAAGGGEGSSIWGAIAGTLSSQTDLNTALTAKQDASQKGQNNGYAGLDGSGKVPTAQLPTFAKADVGLANVDNTSDANKPVSTATTTALALKSNVASPTFTGTLTAPTIVSDVITTKQLATPVTTLTPTGTTATINLALGSMFILDLSSATGDVTLTVQNLLAGTSCVLFVIQGATKRNLIFPTSASPNATVQNGGGANIYSSGIANTESLITMVSRNGTKIHLVVNNNTFA